MPRRGVRVPSGRLCAGIVVGIAVGLLTLWLLMLLGHVLYTGTGVWGFFLVVGAGVVVGCGVAFARRGAGIGASWGLLAAIAAMFFCAVHMEYLTSNVLHDRGREVYGLIQEETGSTLPNPRDGTPGTYTYAVSLPGSSRQLELSTVGQELDTGKQYLMTIDPQRDVRPALGPRPGTDVFHLVWQIICAVFIMLFWLAAVVVGFEPDEIGW
ncbi:hypothetical protein AADR41_10680 [Streptomyces sp. CLV115]|uniref:hypothetical protein n=1 Tax=Streptomyces sp. CLV115 TaxID=3138502 RepID=UPI00313F0FA1